MSHGRHSYAPKTPGRGARSTYSFPLLKNSEIVGCMPNLGIHMTEADLMEPEPEFVMQVYETFVDLLAGVTREELNQPQFVGLGELDHPELHEDSIPRLALYRATKKLLETSGCSGFRMKHMLRPSYKTFRSHLSALINFAKFREERAVSYTKFSAETDQLMDTKVSLNDKKKDLEEKVEVLRTEKENKMPEINELKSTCQSLESEISSLNKQQAMLRHNHEELKNQCKEFRKREKDDKQREEDVLQESERLRSQIVHSPGRFEAEIKNMQRLLAEEKAECAVLEKQRRQMQERLALFNKEHVQVNKTMKVLNEVAEHVAKVKQVTEAKERMESKITTQRAELEDAKTLREHLKRQLKRHEIRTNDVRQQQSVKNEARRQALAAAQADLQSNEQKLTELDEDTDRVRMEIEALQLAIDEEASMHKETMESRRELFDGLVDQVEKYNTTMLDGLAA